VGVYKVFLLSLKFYDFLDPIIRNTSMFIEEFFLWALILVTPGYVFHELYCM
jgi:hypothetical protein